MPAAVRLSCATEKDALTGMRRSSAPAATSPEVRRPAPSSSHCSVTTHGSRVTPTLSHQEMKVSMLGSGSRAAYRGCKQ
eukprot:176579-Prymnesium_polylepis.1